MFQLNCCVYPDEPDVIVTNLARFLEDNFSFQGLNVRVSSVFKVEGKRQWQTQSKPKHEEARTQTQAHLFKYIVDENCVIHNEGMNDVNEKLTYMTVYVRTISGKTISIRCDRRQHRQNQGRN